MTRILAGSSLVASLIFSPAMAQTPGTLTGTILGADGKPKSFARVQLKGPALYAAVSNVSGTFTITKFVVGGTFQITVRQNANTETQTQQITGFTLPIVVHW